MSFRVAFIVLVAVVGAQSYAIERQQFNAPREFTVTTTDRSVAVGSFTTQKASLILDGGALPFVHIGDVSGQELEIYFTDGERGNTTANYKAAAQFMYLLGTGRIASINVDERKGITQAALCLRIEGHAIVQTAPGELGAGQIQGRNILGSSLSLDHASSLGQDECSIVSPK
jgi:hypothetical protein